MYSFVSFWSLLSGGEVAMGRMSRDSAAEASGGAGNKKGMVLPFSPLAMSFDDVKYFVDMPAVSNYLHLNLYTKPNEKHMN